MDAIFCWIQWSKGSTNPFQLICFAEIELSQKLFFVNYLDGPSRTDLKCLAMFYLFIFDEQVFQINHLKI